MTVKRFISNLKNSEIKVFQVPIKGIDKCVNLVKRYQGEASVALDSNQNYLDFEMEYTLHDNGYLVIICKATKNKNTKTVWMHI